MNKISKKQQQINKLEQQLAKDNVRKRKDDTRRKILLGALIMGKMQNNSKYETQIFSELNRFLERDSDRELFGLD